MAQNKLITVIFLLLLFLSCNSQTQNNKKEYMKNLNKIKQNSKDFYNIDNMFIHYPKEYSLDSVVSHIAGFSSLPLKNNIYMSEFSYLVLKDNKPLLIDTTIYNKYTPLNLGFKSDTYCKTIDTNALAKGLLPIPDLEDLLYSQEGRTITFAQILYYDAKQGDFWKQKNECERPSCLGKWKNGYCRGIGIYEDSTGWKKMYWVMYW